MSDEPELSGDEALAAEHALGVLSAAERRAAEARMARDPAFAALVEAWRERLQPLAETLPEQAPPAALWGAIGRALPANDNPRAARAIAFWRATGVGALALAAASIAVTIYSSNRPPTIQAQLLNANLVAPSGASAPLFVAAYDPARRTLLVTSLIKPGVDPAHVHELWVIPAGGGKPRPLGFIEPGKTKAMAVPEGVLPALAAGSSIAVSVEPPGGSPLRDAPSGPIAALGALARL